MGENRQSSPTINDESYCRTYLRNNFKVGIKIIWIFKTNYFIFTYNYSLSDNCMATVKEQTKLILEHPFFKESLEKINNGDTSGFERLLMETMLHCWERVALEASRCYGQYHRANHMMIKSEIRNLPPPTTLDLRLPFVQPKQESRSQSIKMSHRRNKLKVHNGDQLLFTFILEKS